MKKSLLILSLFCTINTAFATTSFTGKNHSKIMLKNVHKVTVSSCSATGTVGTGATKITFTATAPTCKEAIEMVRAALE